MAILKSLSDTLVFNALGSDDIANLSYQVK